MSMKKWRQLVNEKAEVEQQNESILAAIKNNKINEELGQLSGEKLFKPITSRLDRRQEVPTPLPEEQVPDYGMDEFDLNNPFDGDFKPDEETPTPSPSPTPPSPSPASTPPPSPTSTTTITNINTVTTFGGRRRNRITGRKWGNPKGKTKRK